MQYENETHDAFAHRDNKIAQSILFPSRPLNSISHALNKPFSAWISGVTRYNHRCMKKQYFTTAEVSSVLSKTGYANTREHEIIKAFFVLRGKHGVNANISNTDVCDLLHNWNAHIIQ